MRKILEKLSEKIERQELLDFLDIYMQRILIMEK
jgi:hypothetical protein